MTISPKLLVFALLLALAPTFAYASADGEVLRVGLVRFYKGARQVTVSASSGLAVAISTAEKLSLTAGERITISANGDEVTMRQASGEKVTVTAVDTSIPVKIESPTRPARTYRGALEIRARSGVLTVVNVASSEDYLLGVVREEMPPGFPSEALNAQAIAARTYALRNRGKHASEGYVLCDTVHCQLYGGAAAENEKCTRAVLAYGDQLASVLYSSDCGGATQGHADSQPGDTFPYLCGVTEPAGISHASWETSYTITALQKKLLSAGIEEAVDLRSITVAQSGLSGRAVDIGIVGAGTATISGERLRSILGSSVRSTLFGIETSAEGVVTIRGKGVGHGMGLCQVGAGQLAKPPFSYTCEQILSHYFPGTKISGSIKTVSAPTPTVAKTAPPAAVPETTPRRIEVTTVPPKTAQPREQEIEVRLKAPDRL